MRRWGSDGHPSTLVRHRSPLTSSVYCSVELSSAVQGLIRAQLLVFRPRRTAKLSWIFIFCATESEKLKYKIFLYSCDASSYVLPSSVIKMGCFLADLCSNRLPAMAGASTFICVFASLIFWRLVCQYHLFVHYSVFEFGIDFDLFYSSVYSNFWTYHRGFGCFETSFSSYNICCHDVFDHTLYILASDSWNCCDWMDITSSKDCIPSRFRAWVLVANCSTLHEEMIALKAKYAPFAIARSCVGRLTARLCDLSAVFLA